MNEKFIEENINEINESIRSFCKRDPSHDEVKIKEFLKNKLLGLTEDEKKDLYEEFKMNDFVKSRIKNMANNHILYKSDLQTLLLKCAYKNFFDMFTPEELFNGIDTEISKKIEENPQLEKLYKANKNEFKKISLKFINLILQGGFQSNIQEINEGVMVANSGDSAQFMFLARAILLGFTCSNVDVRSSRYDTIIDYEGILLKCQVKGTSSERLDFKDRDRGGQGIDHLHERNRGKEITKEDCDIYIGVDKSSGTCYILPMYEVEGFNVDKKSLRELQEYRENWGNIERVANEIKNRQAIPKVIRKRKVFRKRKNY